MLTLSALLLAVGCGGKKPSSRRVPPAPPISSAPSSRASKPAGAPAEPGVAVDPDAPAIWTQEGYASWYGGEYNHRKAANGEVYEQNALTAAHNTLPLNSVVRVVNLKTHQATVVRITDRGPFVTDRIIDLSVASAKAINVYLPGTAPVRLEVLKAPKPIESGGRWCVQIGAFHAHSGASRLKAKLMERYPEARVIEFQGPTGWWVRIRLPEDDKKKTREVYRRTEVSEGAVFLVRLD